MGGRTLGRKEMQRERAHIQLSKGVTMSLWLLICMCGDGKIPLGRGKNHWKAVGSTIPEGHTGQGIFTKLVFPPTRIAGLPNTQGIRESPQKAIDLVVELSQLQTK